MTTPLPALTRREFLMSSCLMLLPALKSSAAAQSTPVPSPIPPPDRELLVAVRLEALPAKRVNAFFVRYTFEANVTVPTFERVGSALYVVESGRLTLEADTQVMVHRAGESGQSSATPASADSVVLKEGDGALVPNDALMSLRNDTDEPATLLALFVYGPYREFSYTHPVSMPEMSGITREVIGYGTGAFEEVPAVMLIQRDVVRMGGSDYSSTLEGIEIGAIVSGSARATLSAGEGWMTPGLLSHDEIPILPGEVLVPAGAIMDLGATDGYVNIGGSINWRATGTDPLVVYRAQLVPLRVPA